MSRILICIKLAKQRELEEKKQRMKQLRQAAKEKDKKQRTKYKLKNGKALCAYCKQMIDELEYDDHIVSHPTQIRSRIWLGNAENSKDLEFMTRFNISHVLNCTKEIECPESVSSRLTGFKRIAIQDKNHETILDYIKDSNHFVEEALSHSKSTLFVHCREGRSRSVSFLCAYLMWKEGITFLSALADIRSKRHIVLPNNKFYAELERFDKEIIEDRKGDSQQFGTPDASFKLKRVKRKVIQQNDDQIKKDKMGGDEYKEEDDMKNGDFLTNVEPMTLDLHSKSANVPSMAHSRKRSNSFHSPSSPTELPAKYLGAYSSAMSTGSTSMQSLASSRSTLSPVCEPVNESVSAPMRECSNGSVLSNGNDEGKKKKKKKKEKSPKKGKKKKEKSMEMDHQDVNVDLNVEEALDVTDVFPPQKKKKGTKGKKKKKKKSKVDENKTDI